MFYPARSFCRAALLLLAATPLAAQQPGPQPLSAFQRQKVQTLLEEKLPCLGCHTVNGKGGRIGPDLSGAGTRLDGAALAQQLERPRGIMPRILLPAATRDLLVAWLMEQRSTSSPAAPGQAPASAPAASPGAQLYHTHCAACHGTRGQGDGYNAAHLDRPPARHADARAMGARTDDRLFDAIYAGGAIMGGSARMPPYGQSLSTQQIRSLVAYIRELCRCRQPEWADATR